MSFSRLLIGKLNKRKQTKMGMERNDVGSSSSSCSNSKDKNNADKTNIDSKLRVLCLHGYRQNGDSFRSKLGSFRKQVSKYAEFVFITAPHKAAPQNEGEEVPDEQRSWWFNKDDRTFKGTNVNGPAYGFEESLRFIEDVWKDQGPFQGLLGFSQGACLVGLICGLAERKIISMRPDFAVIASGFKSGSLVHSSAYQSKIFTPSLHIYGTTDDIIPPHMSQELLEHFALVEVLPHSGGHYFPATAATKSCFVNFFRDRLVDYLEQEELKNATYAENVEQEEDSSD